VLVHASASDIRGMVGPWASLEEVDAERCRLRMTVDNLDWPALTLGALRAEFEVVQPPELVAHLHEWSARFARA
jgi:predicted DNA-binding transcriptional regulator YafY